VKPASVEGKKEGSTLANVRWVERYRQLPGDGRKGYGPLLSLPVFLTQELRG
jgi:hypothetical protein